MTTPVLLAALAILVLSAGVVIIDGARPTATMGDPPPPGGSGFSTFVRSNDLLWDDRGLALGLIVLLTGATLAAASADSFRRQRKKKNRV